MTDDITTQLAVIGAGPGGYAAAFLAADLGLQVTLIDPEANPGGVCLYRGCIPSKTLLHAVQVIRETDIAKAWGLTFKGVSVDWQRLVQRKDQVVAQLTEGLGRLVTRRKIDYLRGHAVFLDEKHLKIENPDGGLRRIAFQHAVIATGSRAATLSLFDQDSDRVLNAARALDLAEIPKKLLVVGGGYIGLELGSVYAGLGSKVSLVEMTPGLLPGVDRDLVRPLHNRLIGQFEEIRLQTRVTQVKTRKKGLWVTSENQEGETGGALFDKILVAVGRQPNSRNLGLETIGIKVDEKGFIQVDDQRRTSLDHIFAIGDVAGEPMLAHKASHEGRVAVEVIAGRRAAYEPQAIPAVIFTDPEIAWAGLTESQARAANLPFRVARFPWAASSRAATLGQTEGLTKLLVEPETERVIGMGIVGRHAGELIAEGVLAIETGANVTDLALSIHPHPTLSETVMEAAHVFHGTATHFHYPKRKGE